ncbi:MAG: ADP-ribosylglycohydrolase family protein [Bacteroidales bacterium]|jgi:ADP-ribosylglycohydrolase|nr:ADP-ribosylglycohydrolase family protein [Bacteroidales bacterium]MCI1785648.1 ADP-ribosylglycohydrolase family protein [Bacteroidales bacterium]
MKVSKSIIIAVGMLLVCFTVNAKRPVPTEVKMSKAVLMDKIRGAWAGKVIGCTYGGPTEFRYATTINKNIDIPWSDHIIKQWYDNSPGLYDDVYMNLTFVDVFGKEGLDAPISSFANAFAYAKYPLWHANLQARYNIRHGIMPPQSGYWENNAHADDIDFQIEADYAGIMSPGMPNAASYYCDGIGHMMNYGDGWYGGVYVASMLSLAFVNSDIEYIVSEALKTIPKQSKYHKAIADVIRWHEKYPEDWELTWAKVNENYGFDVGCPEGVYSSYDIDAVLNSAYIVIGLLYGDKNFYRTIDISTRCGADSDCNPSSAAGILGAVLGFSGIPDYWKKPVLEVEDRDFKYTDISLKRATSLSLDQAVQVIERNGGKVSDKAVMIKVQTPKPVRLEQGFTGHWPVELRTVKKYIDKTDIKFEGNGIVVRYYFTKPKNYKNYDYSAKVEAYLDGVLSKTMDIPMFGNGQTRELYYIYKLPVASHTVSFKWLNKEDGLNIVVNSAIIYSDKLKLTKHEDK